MSNNFLFFTLDFGVNYDVGMFFLFGMFLLHNFSCNSYIISDWGSASSHNCSVLIMWSLRSQLTVC